MKLRDFLAIFSLSTCVKEIIHHENEGERIMEVSLRQPDFSKRTLVHHLISPVNLWLLSYDIIPTVNAIINHPSPLREARLQYREHNLLIVLQPQHEIHITVYYSIRSSLLSVEVNASAENEMKEKLRIRRRCVLSFLPVTAVAVSSTLRNATGRRGEKSNKGGQPCQNAITVKVRTCHAPVSHHLNSFFC